MMFRPRASLSRLSWRHFAVMALVLVLATGGLWFVTDKANGMPRTPFGDRLVGGWGLTTPDSVESAAAADVNFAFLYGPPPEPSSPLGQALANANIRVISAEVADVVSAYECTRTHTVAPRPEQSRAESYCADDPGYSQDRVYEEVEAIVRRNVGNPLVAGYWVLDDTPDWDFGSLKPVLDRLATIIPADRPTVCGFSAGLGSNGKSYWTPGRAENFSRGG